MNEDVKHVLNKLDERIERLEEKVNKLPLMEPVVSRSKDGKWITTGFKILDIRSKNYYKKMLEGENVDVEEETVREKESDEN